MLRILILFLLFATSSFAQQSLRFGRSSIEKLPPRFNLNTSDLRDYIYAEIPENFRKEEYPRSSFRFADQTSVQLKNLFSSGQVYADWPSLENYLNEILKKVVPPELKDAPYIRAYILKRGNFNAFMSASGMMFINIGVLDAVTNEAQIASIIAHELAHFYLNHSIKAYVKATNGDFNPGFLLSKKGAYSKFSIQNELDADSMAVHWLANSGYAVSASQDVFDVLERNQANWLSRQQRIHEIVESTHPNPLKRKEKLKMLIQSNKTDGSKFLVSENKFTAFKEESKKEILKNLLNNFDYYNCIEKAFKYHVYESNNSVYIYYLMEAIRRNCYLDSDLWDKSFIADRYYNKENLSINNEKKKIEKHFFEFEPAYFLNLEEDKISAKFYWENIKFITYEEAFLFFSQVAELLNEPECVLSKALSISFNKKQRDILLRNYLTNANILHKDFAENLLNGTIAKRLTNKKLSVFSRFQVTVRQGKEEILIREELNNKLDYLEGVLKSQLKDIQIANTCTCQNYKVIGWATI